jgi:tRNA-dihydrouridine synthase A
MLGRAAYHTPGLLGEGRQGGFGADKAVTAAEAVENYKPYVARELAEGGRTWPP